MTGMKKVQRIGMACGINLRIQQQEEWKGGRETGRVKRMEDEEKHEVMNPSVVLVERVGQEGVYEALPA